MASGSVKVAAVLVFQLLANLASFLTATGGGGTNTGDDIVKWVLAAVDTSIGLGAMLLGLIKPALPVLGLTAGIKGKVGAVAKAALFSIGAVGNVATLAGITGTAGLAADLVLAGVDLLTGADALAVGFVADLAAVLGDAVTLIGALTGDFAAAFTGALVEAFAATLVADLAGALAGALAVGLTVGLAGDLAADFSGALAGALAGALITGLAFAGTFAAVLATILTALGAGLVALASGLAALTAGLALPVLGNGLAAALEAAGFAFLTGATGFFTTDFFTILVFFLTGAFTCLVSLQNLP